MPLFRTISFGVALAVSSMAAVSGEPEAMTGSEIHEALAGRSLIYDGSGATQSFARNGYTEYNSGRPSAGSWGVRGDQYCSVWPPSDVWSCYTMERDEETLRFIGAGGDVTVGRYR